MRLVCDVLQLEEVRSGQKKEMQLEEVRSGHKMEMQLEEVRLGQKKELQLFMDYLFLAPTSLEVTIN